MWVRQARERWRAVVLAALWALLVGCTSASTPPVADPARTAGETVVYVVRHAEAGGAPSGDPPLTAAGSARAIALRDALAHAGVEVIYTSDRARTQLTAGPLAGALGIEGVAVPVQSGAVEAHVAETARRVREESRGRTVLIVGHSNTVPLLVAALAALEVPPIRETEFDRLYILRITANAPPKLTAARYGAGN